MKKVNFPLVSDIAPEVLQLSIGPVHNYIHPYIQSLNKNAIHDTDDYSRTTLKKKCFFKVQTLLLNSII